MIVIITMNTLSCIERYNVSGRYVRGSARGTGDVAAGLAFRTDDLCRCRESYVKKGLTHGVRCSGVADLKFSITESSNLYFISEV